MLKNTGLVSSYTKNIRSIQFVIDFLLVNISFVAAEKIYIYYFLSRELIPIDLIPYLLYCNTIWFLLIRIFGAYSILRFETSDKIILRALKMTLSYILLLLLDVLFFRYVKISINFILIYSSIFFISILTLRTINVYLLKTFRKKGVNNKKVVLIGMDENSSKMFDILNKELSFGYKVLGYFTYAPHQKSLGSLNDFYSYSKINQVDEIYISTKDASPTDIKQIINFCDSNFIRVKLIPDFQNFTLNRRINIDFYADMPVLHLRKEPLELPVNKYSKRIFDLIFSLLVITTIFPWLFPIVIILQKIFCKGPVFFIQERSGQDNLVFKCLKFRTMKENNESNSKGTLKNDPRITPFGKILRKTRIDELPQFINVLLGQMSIVGPRPHMLKHTEEYSKLVEQFLVRQFVKPGITGWAQTTGYIDESQKLQEMTDKVKKDVWYIENWSFILDLRIIALTILNIIRKDKNAY